MRSIPFGKRLKSDVEKRMFYGSPNSGTVKTLPAGKPSPKITSYILQNGGYYQLEGDQNGNYYIKDSKDLAVVDANAKDDSAALSGLFNWIGDAAENTITSVEKKAGFVGDAFGKELEGIGGFTVGFGKDLRIVLIGGVALLAVALIAMVLNAVR